MLNLRPCFRATSLSDRIEAQEEERELQTEMAEQQRLEEAATEAFEATLSESEDSDGTDEERSKPPEKTAVTAETGVKAASPISPEELEQNRQDFHTIMQVNFSLHAIRQPAFKVFD